MTETPTATAEHPALTNLNADYPSPAAAALDPFNLEAGTAVSWLEDKGWGTGSARRFGTITKVTAKSYLVQSYIGGNARIDRDNPHKRRFRAIRTPAEHAEMIERNKAFNEQRRAEQREQAVAVQRGNAEKAARNAALNQLAEAHPDEFNALYVTALERTLAERGVS